MGGNFELNTDLTYPSFALVIYQHQQLALTHLHEYHQS